MQLKLKNIGMIKEADITIDGLTVIAGENDTGKSTVGKALFAMLNGISLDGELVEFYYQHVLEKTFKLKLNQFPKDAFIDLYTNHAKYYIELGEGVQGASTFHRDKHFKGVMFVESPLVWNLQDLFGVSANIESHLKMMGQEIEIPYPYLMKDLYFKLATQKGDSQNDNSVSLKRTLVEIMQGEFKQDKQSRIFSFHRAEKTFDLINVATGIKTFGIIQVLIDNNRLVKDTVLILDEPEVHLHPKWQLKMAEIIVELIKNGVKVVVNSHSPYMIEALQRYSELEKVNADFYLAEDGVIGKVDDSNSKTLSKIFSKLSEPFDVFDEMESERFQNG